MLPYESSYYTLHVYIDGYVDRRSDQQLVCNTRGPSVRVGGNTLRVNEQRCVLALNGISKLELAFAYFETHIVVD